jgi:hypothetical protein
MRSVFLVNFAALKEPKIYMSSIRKASLTELEKLRKCAESLNYQYGSRVKKIPHPLKPTNEAGRGLQSRQRRLKTSKAFNT